MTLPPKPHTKQNQNKQQQQTKQRRYKPQSTKLPHQKNNIPYSKKKLNYNIKNQQANSQTIMFMLSKCFVTKIKRGHKIKLIAHLT